MTPMLAISATVAVAAALLWPVAASALHDLPCGPFSETVVDRDTGQTRCTELAPETRDVLRRTRQLQQEQERRTRALAIGLRQNQPRQRVRDLAIEAQQLEYQQSLVQALEFAKQRQLNRERSEQALQPALSLEQSVNRQRGLNRVEADETRRRALLRANELRRRQNVLRQQANLPASELESEVRARQRQLEIQQRGP